MKLYIRRYPSMERHASERAYIVGPVGRLDRPSNRVILVAGEEKRLRLPIHEIARDDHVAERGAPRLELELFKSCPKPKDGYRVRRIILTYSSWEGGYYISFRPLKFVNETIYGVERRYPVNEDKDFLSSYMDYVLCRESVAKVLGWKHREHVGRFVWLRWKKGGLKRAS